MNFVHTVELAHRVPVSRLNAVRWSVGIVAAVLWFAAFWRDLPRVEQVWSLIAAMLAVQGFGITSSALMLLRPRAILIQRVTNWYAVVCSVIIWVIGLGAIAWYGISFTQAAILLIAVGVGIFWLGLIWWGLRPIHPAARERE